MLSKPTLALIGTLALCTTSFAGTITLVTSAVGMGANDSVNWSQLGGDGTSVSGPLTTTSTGGATVGTAITNTAAQIYVNGGSFFTPALGNPFGSGDSLLAFFNGADDGTGPATMSTPALYGMGAALVADSPGAFTAQIEIFGQSGLLDTLSESSDANGDPIFIGFLDSDPEVTSATFSLIAGTNVNNEQNYLGDFAIDTLLLTEPVASTPEPGSLLLIGGGFLALGMIRRRSAF